MNEYQLPVIDIPSSPPAPLEEALSDPTETFNSPILPDFDIPSSPPEALPDPISDPPTPDVHLDPHPDPHPAPIDPIPNEEPVLSFEMAQKQRIQDVLDVIGVHFGSLGLFLITLFSHKSYFHHRARFCQTHLLTIIGILWNCVPGRKVLLPWAFERISDILWKEMKTFGVRCRVGYKNITRQVLELYTIQKLHSWLIQDAPNFSSLLTVLVSRVRGNFASDRRGDSDCDSDDEEDMADKEMVSHSFCIFTFYFLCFLYFIG